MQHGDNKSECKSLGSTNAGSASTEANAQQMINQQILPQLHNKCRRLDKCKVYNTKRP